MARAVVLFGLLLTTIAGCAAERAAAPRPAITPPDRYLDPPAPQAPPPAAEPRAAEASALRAEWPPAALPSAPRGLPGPARPLRAAHPPGAAGCCAHGQRVEPAAPPASFRLPATTVLPGA